MNRKHFLEKLIKSQAQKSWLSSLKPEAQVEWDSHVQKQTKGEFRDHKKSFLHKHPHHHPQHDPHSNTELLLHVDNNRSTDMNHQWAVKNLVGHKQKGKYDHDKARKLMGYVADHAAKTYHQDYGTATQKWHDAFPKHQRTAAAKDLADRFHEDYEAGEHDHLKKAMHSHKLNNMTPEMQVKWDKTRSAVSTDDEATDRLHREAFEHHLSYTRHFFNKNAAWSTHHDATTANKHFEMAHLHHSELSGGHSFNEEAEGVKPKKVDATHFVSHPHDSMVTWKSSGIKKAFDPKKIHHAPEELQVAWDTHQEKHGDDAAKEMHLAAHKHHMFTSWAHAHESQRWHDAHPRSNKMSPNHMAQIHHWDAGTDHYRAAHGPRKYSEGAYKEPPGAKDHKPKSNDFQHHLHDALLLDHLKKTLDKLPEDVQVQWDQISAKHGNSAEAKAKLRNHDSVKSKHHEAFKHHAKQYIRMVTHANKAWEEANDTNRLRNTAPQERREVLGTQTSAHAQKGRELDHHANNHDDHARRHWVKAQGISYPSDRRQDPRHDEYNANQFEKEFRENWKGGDKKPKEFTPHPHDSLLTNEFLNKALGEHDKILKGIAMKKTDDFKPTKDISGSKAKGPSSATAGSDFLSDQGQGTQAYNWTEQGTVFGEALKAALIDYNNGEHYRVGDKVHHEEMGAGRVLNVKPKERCPTKGCRYAIRFSDYDMDMYDHELSPIDSKYKESKLMMRQKMKKSAEYQALIEVASEFSEDGQIGSVINLIKTGGEELAKSFHDNFLGNLGRKMAIVAKSRDIPFSHRTNYLGTEIQHVFHIGDAQLIHHRIGNEIKVDLTRPEHMTQALMGLVKCMQFEIHRFYTDDGIRRTGENVPYELRKSLPSKIKQFISERRKTKPLGENVAEKKTGDLGGHMKAYAHHAAHATHHFNRHKEGSTEANHSRLHAMHHTRAIAHAAKMGWKKDTAIGRMDHFTPKKPSGDFVGHDNDKFLKSLAKGELLQLPKKGTKGHLDAFKHHTGLGKFHRDAGRHDIADRHEGMAFIHGTELGWNSQKDQEMTDLVKPKNTSKMKYQKHLHDRFVFSKIEMEKRVLDRRQPIETKRALGRRKRQPRRLTQQHMSRMKQFLEGRYDPASAQKRKRTLSQEGR